MKDRKTKISSVFLIILGFLIGVPVTHLWAQGVPQTTQPQQEQVNNHYTDEQLKTFIRANEKAVDIQKKGEKKTIQAIEEEDIDMDKFNKIMQGQQDPNVELDASAEEMNAFNNAAKKVMVVQQELQTEVVKAVEDEGLPVSEYHEMMTAYQQSPELQSRVNKILEEQNN